MPTGSKLAASSSTLVVVVRDLRLLAAHDRRERDRALAVGDQQVGRVELAHDAVERADLLALRGRGGRGSGGAGSLSASNACSGLPSASMT